MSVLHQQPEYTGENRCLPCTVINAAIALAVGALIGFGLTVTTRTPSSLAIAVSGGFILASLAVIYLRGYLVPGTPTLTDRYLPERALELLGKEPKAPAGPPADSHVDPKVALLEANVIEPCSDRDDLCVSGEVRRAWNDRMERLVERGVETEELVEHFGVPVGDCTLEAHNDVRIVYSDSTLVGKWPSEAALVADAAAAPVLSDRLSDWGGLTHAARRELLYSLRLFIDDCPTAEGGVEFGRERVSSTCCGTTEIFAVTCEESGERIFEGGI